jgi:chorismate-pyruvate lyase
MEHSAPTPAPGFLATLRDLDLHALGLLPRILLISDGTLTDIVEAAFAEPIRLVKLALETAPALAPVDDLGVQAGQPLMRREILLQGACSGRNYVYAESYIALDALPVRLREDLITTDRPLGRLWVEHKLETRKEILRVWRVPIGGPCVHFAPAAPGGLLARTYRVISGGRPIMLISEYFPAD